jgi:hypothetical protein
MPNKRISLACTTFAFAALGLAAACSSNKDNGNGSSTNSTSTTSNQSTSGGSTSGSGTTSSSIGDASTPPGLTIDDQSSTGSAISLKGLPSGVSQGTWFTYGSDSGSQATPGANGQAITPKQYSTYAFAAVTNGPTSPAISKAACLSSSGFDGYSVGQGFHFAAKLPGDAGPDSGVNAQPIPFDVSKYTGISFWAMGASDAGAYSIRVKFPDDQTDGDPFAAPGNPYGNPPSACYGDSSTDTSKCFDDFSDDVSMPSTWQQVNIKFATDLGQHAFGQAFTALDQQHVYGIEFEVEGLGPPGGDAGLAPGFNFCIAQIAFTQ